MKTAQNINSVTWSILIVCVAIFIRLFIASLGYNYDMQSWDIVSDIVLDGKVIYANTSRYNYGYVWGLIVAGIKWLLELFELHGIRNFHIGIAFFLALIDVGIALWAKKYYGNKLALLFLFNPISILSTGFHSQFENLALLIALLSIMPLLHRPDSWKSLILSACLMGLSLSTKHLFFLFPCWFLFRQDFSFNKRVVYGAISCGIFILFFLPFMGSPDAQEGIFSNVLGYNNFEGNSLLGHCVEFLIGHSFGLDFYINHKSILLKIAFIGSLVLVGYLFRRERLEVFLLVYTIALLVTSSMMLAEYFVFALLAVLVFRKKIASPIFVLYVTIFFIIDANAQNIGRLGVINILPDYTHHFLALSLNQLVAQLLLAILLVQIYMDRVIRPKARINPS